MIAEETRQRLISLADKYETKDFINGDPSWFMHQVKGRANQEVIGFIASVLSYGRRDQFMPKIGRLLNQSHGEPAQWLSTRTYHTAIPDNSDCFYRLYNNSMMRRLLDAIADMLDTHGTIGDFATAAASHHQAIEVLEALAGFFRDKGIKGMVPSPLTSVAKRPCMFLRWMVRDQSPVDLGLWTDFIDKRSLYIPLDTHVLQEAHSLNLVTGKTASWNTTVRLTNAMREVFPDDPARGDFALFGYGVDKDK